MKQTNIKDTTKILDAAYLKELEVFYSDKLLTPSMETVAA